MFQLYMYWNSRIFIVFQFLHEAWISHRRIEMVRIWASGTKVDLTNIAFQPFVLCWVLSFNSSWMHDLITISRIGREKNKLSWSKLIWMWSVGYMREDCKPFLTCKTATGIVFNFLLILIVHSFCIYFNHSKDWWGAGNLPDLCLVPLFIYQFMYAKLVLLLSCCWTKDGVIAFNKSFIDSFKQVLKGRRLERTDRNI